MKRSRFSEAQIISILKEHQAGMSAGDLCRRHGISDATFNIYEPRLRHLNEQLFPTLRHARHLIAAWRED